jgi:small subunit ribosomal protein S13
MVVTNFLDRFIAPTDKLGPFLTNYYGIGQRRSKMLCQSVGVSYSKLIRSVPPGALKLLESSIRRTVPKDFLLRRQVNTNLLFKFNSNSLAGQRLYQGLPSHRQRTKTNARTARRLKIDFSKIILFA